MSVQQDGPFPTLFSTSSNSRTASTAPRRLSGRAATFWLWSPSPLLVGVPAWGRAAGPEGELTWGVHISLAPTWFDPAETPGIITPFMVMYALHDAMVKPMPGKALAPSLAEAWTVSPDGLTYEFVLRKGPKFHNGEAITAEDVKFSFERYRGTSAKQIKDRVAAIETPDPHKVAFKLKAPWPDFLTFYASATGAGWIVPKKYVEKVGEEGYKKAPIGAGPYKFVSFTPGVELTLDAFDQYWRKTPSVKRLVFRSIHDEFDAAGGAQAGRGRHRLLDPRRARRGAAAHEGPDPQARGHHGPVLDLLRRPVGPQVAMARPARAAGGEPGDRPQHHQPSPDARPLASLPAASSPTASSIIGRLRRQSTIRPRPRNCWPKRVIPMASMPANTIATPHTPTWPKP